MSCHGRRTQTLFTITPKSSSSPSKSTGVALDQARSTKSDGDSKSQTSSYTDPPSLARQQVPDGPRRSPRSKSQAGPQQPREPPSETPVKRKHGRPRKVPQAELQAPSQPPPGSPAQPRRRSSRIVQATRPPTPESTRSSSTVSSKARTILDPQTATHLLINYSGHAAKHLLLFRGMKNGLTLNPYLSEIAKLRDYPDGRCSQGYDWERAKRNAKRNAERRGWHVVNDDDDAQARRKSMENIYAGLGALSGVVIKGKRRSVVPDSEDEEEMEFDIEEMDRELARFDTPPPTTESNGAEELRAEQTRVDTLPPVTDPQGTEGLNVSPKRRNPLFPSTSEPKKAMELDVQQKRRDSLLPSATEPKKVCRKESDVEQPRRISPRRLTKPPATEPKTTATKPLATDTELDREGAEHGMTSEPSRKGKLKKMEKQWTRQEIDIGMRSILEEDELSRDDEPPKAKLRKVEKKARRDSSMVIELSSD